MSRCYGNCSASRRPQLWWKFTFGHPAVPMSPLGPQKASPSTTTPRLSWTPWRPTTVSLPCPCGMPSMIKHSWVSLASGLVTSCVTAFTPTSWVIGKTSQFATSMVVLSCLCVGMSLGSWWSTFLLHDNLDELGGCCSLTSHSTLGAGQHGFSMLSLDQETGLYIIKHHLRLLHNVVHGCMTMEKLSG